MFVLFTLHVHRVLNLYIGRIKKMLHLSTDGGTDASYKTRGETPPPAKHFNNIKSCISTEPD